MPVRITASSSAYEVTYICDERLHDNCTAHTQLRIKLLICPSALKYFYITLCSEPNEVLTRIFKFIHTFVRILCVDLSTNLRNRRCGIHSKKKLSTFDFKVINCYCCFSAWNLSFFSFLFFQKHRTSFSSCLHFLLMFRHFNQNDCCKSAAIQK